MSIIIALKQDGVVYMGADTRRSRGTFIGTIKATQDMKIHQISNQILLGGVGKVANIQVMTENARAWFDTKGKALTKKFIVTEVVPRYYNQLKALDLLRKNKDDSLSADCDICVTDGDKIFLIDNDFVVTELNEYLAIGCTDYIAYAHLRNKGDLSPNDAILRALRGSVFRDDGVGAPYILINTRDMIMQEVEE